jgi:hypothetical protein
VLKAVGLVQVGQQSLQDSPAVQSFDRLEHHLVTLCENCQDYTCSTHVQESHAQQQQTLVS